MTNAGIARVWRGRTQAARANEYAAYLETTGLRDYTGAEGNRGVLVLRRTVGDVEEFLLVSLWDSLDSAAQFSGGDPDVARFYPRDEEFLLELDPTVEHYTVEVAGELASQGSPAAGGPSARR